MVAFFKYLLQHLKAQTSSFGGPLPESFFAVGVEQTQVFFYLLCWFFSFKVNARILFILARNLINDPMNERTNEWRTDWLTEQVTGLECSIRWIEYINMDTHNNKSGITIGINSNDSNSLSGRQNKNVVVNDNYHNAADNDAVTFRSSQN